MTRASTTYHHGDLRAALVQTATELARADGPDGVVLREAARRLGVSHNAAYRHFADRTELMSEVASNAFVELASAMRAAQAKEDRKRSHRGDPAARARGRLRALGQTYVDFALAEPGLFRLAFHGQLKEGPGDAEPFNLLGEALDDLVAADVLTAERRPGAEMLCWSAVHGFAVLVLDGPLRGVPAAERDQALTAMLDEMDYEL
jgi:AcrR family transcriptional regulator